MRGRGGCGWRQACNVIRNYLINIHHTELQKGYIYIAIAHSSQPLARPCHTNRVSLAGEN